MSMWIKMTQLGSNWRHEDRVRESCLQQTQTCPPIDPDPVTGPHQEDVKYL